jgi:dolichyl-diphosphooligosaccharide--protein glycosyltransferase
MGAMRRRAAFVVGLGAAALLGVVLRLHTRGQVVAEGGVRPFDSDSAYHLRRARFAAASFPRTILFDPLMNFPEGGVPIWPPLYDAALALPSKLAGNVSEDAVARGAAWIPVALAAGTILLAAVLGRRLIPGSAAAGAGAATFLAICPAHILWSQYGHVDQHAAESFCGLLALVLFLASRETTEARGNAAREAAAGLALALAVLSWQGGIYWGAIFALSLAVEAGRRPVLRAVALTLGLPALLVAGATAAWLGWLRPPLTYVSFGFFQPLFLAALCGGAALVGLILRIARHRTETGRREVLASLAVVVLGAAVTLPFANDLLAGLRNGIGYVAGATQEVAGAGGYVSYPKDWLKGIFEARPLLAEGPGLAWKQLSAAFFLSPLAVIAWALRARRGDRAGVHGALAIWGAVTLFLALSQRLNVHYAAPLAALTLVEAARFTAEKLARRGALARVAAAAAGLSLALPMQKGLQDELASVHVPGSDLFATLEWMRKSLPHAVDAYDPRLLGPPPFPESLSRASSVMAPWSMGHLLLYEAELPVVANNFGYGFMDSIRFFLAPSEEEALEIARRRRARWIVATDLVPRMNDYASYLGQPPLLQTSAQGPVPTPAYFRTMQSRLYDFEGRGASGPGLEIPPLRHVRLIHRSQSAIQRGGRWVARWAVFEILDSPNPNPQGEGGPGGP